MQGRGKYQEVAARRISSSLVGIMSTVDQKRTSHSADVQMHLSVNGHTLTIGHLGPDYVVLDTSIDYPPSDAEISLSVDGRKSQWKVRLLDGLSASQARSRISTSG